MTQKIRFDILDQIVSNGPLLSDVSAFLDIVGESDISEELALFENDVGVQVFNDIGDPDSEEVPAEEGLARTEAFLQDADPSALVRTAELHAQRQPLTYDRLVVLDKASAVLLAHGPLPDQLDVRMRDFKDGLIKASDFAISKPAIEPVPKF